MLEYFSSYFKEVFTANDGKEALEIYKQNRPFLNPKRHFPQNVADYLHLSE
jgi:CheY-like chemotaxis protein